MLRKSKTYFYAMLRTGKPAHCKATEKMSLNLQDCTQILFGSDDVIVNPNPNEQDSNRNTSAAHGLLGNSQIIDDAYATLPAFTLGLESQLPQVGAHYERPETQIPVSQQASQRCGRSATKSRKDRPSTVSRRTDSQSVSNKRKPTCYNCKLDGSWIQVSTYTKYNETRSIFAKTAVCSI